MGDGVAIINASNDLLHGPDDRASAEAVTLGEVTRVHPRDKGFEYDVAFVGTSGTVMEMRVRAADLILKVRSVEDVTTFMNEIYPRKVLILLTGICGAFTRLTQPPTNHPSEKSCVCDRRRSVHPEPSGTVPRRSDQAVLS